MCVNREEKKRTRKSPFDITSGLKLNLTLIVCRYIVIATNYTSAKQFFSCLRRAQKHTPSLHSLFHAVFYYSVLNGDKTFKLMVCATFRFLGVVYRARTRKRLIENFHLLAEVISSVFSYCLFVSTLSWQLILFPAKQFF